ncbi:hypothetical protein SAMN04488056_110169 [Cohaesibacter marisflavi]|uniref:Uncharacterized protein n=1 Tax=Cohaesibacter marisflavi TaxID=655353 RepID=A0A1I5J2W6_9HYPH|nr:hypothetical protein SAMN04488056_110169 [Cohaesibacter marisflavi]
MIRPLHRIQHRSPYLQRTETHLRSSTQPLSLPDAQSGLLRIARKSMTNLDVHTPALIGCIKELDKVIIFGLIHEYEKARFCQIT